MPSTCATSFSQELRLNGKAGTLLDYTLGGYYFGQTTTYATHQFLPYAVPGFEFFGNDPVEASSYAAFVNASWHLTDALNVNAGVRYTKEDKTYHYSRLPVGGALVLGLDSLNTKPGEYSGSKIDYRVNVDYRWNEQFMTYGSVSTAFKGGGTNARPFGPLQVVPFDKENLTAYEVGFKTDFLDRRLRVNVAGFINKYKDIQLTLLSCPSSCRVIPARRRSMQATPTSRARSGSRGSSGGRPVDRRFVQRPELQVHRLSANTGLTVGQEAPGRQDEVEHGHPVRGPDGQRCHADAALRLLVPGRLQPNASFAAATGSPVTTWPMRA